MIPVSRIISFYMWYLLPYIKNIFHLILFWFFVFCKYPSLKARYVRHFQNVFLAIRNRYQHRSGSRKNRHYCRLNNTLDLLCSYISYMQTPCCASVKPRLTWLCCLIRTQ